MHFIYFLSLAVHPSSQMSCITVIHHKFISILYHSSVKMQASIWRPWFPLHWRVVVTYFTRLTLYHTTRIASAAIFFGFSDTLCILYIFYHCFALDILSL
jgi:hypothetical protein